MFNTSLISNKISDSSKDNLLDKLYNVNYNAFYRAYVVDNNDSSNLGRVKIRIPALHRFKPSNPGYVASDALPWASPAIFPAGNDSGSYLIPNIGDMVFVTFEYDSPSSPIYFGGIITKAGTSEKSISSNNINNNQKYTYEDNDLIKDIKHGTERVIYKSLKGATILVDDYDGEETLKIIDQSGQTILLENYGNKLDRRGSDLGTSDKSKITITNNVGDKITLKNGKTYIQSNSLVIESTSIDVPGINRDFAEEASIADDIIGTSIVEYDSSTDSNAIVYQKSVDEILGYGNAVNKNIIDEAIRLTEKINNEIITNAKQTDYSDNMVAQSTMMTEEIKGE